MIVSIAGIDKAELLAELVNAAKARGLGLRHDRDMTVDEAREWISEGRRNDMRPAEGWPITEFFDYVHGRPIKCDISGDELDTALYDRDNGAGAGESVVARLRANSP